MLTDFNTNYYSWLLQLIIGIIVSLNKGFTYVRITAGKMRHVKKYDYLGIIWKL